MIDLYELQIVTCTSQAGNGNLLRLEHRFPSIPDTETIKALRDEAATMYSDLYGDEPEVVQIVAYHLTNKDIAAQHGAVVT